MKYIAGTLKPQQLKNSYLAIHYTHEVHVQSNQKQLKNASTHMKFKLLYSQTETRKRSILIKTGTKFCTKNECALVAQVHGDLCAIFSNNATMAQGAWLS